MFELMLDLSLNKNQVSLNKNQVSLNKNQVSLNKNQVSLNKKLKTRWGLSNPSLATKYLYNELRKLFNFAIAEIFGDLTICLKLKLP